MSASLAVNGFVGPASSAGMAAYVDVRRDKRRLGRARIKQEVRGDYVNAADAPGMAPTQPTGKIISPPRPPSTCLFESFRDLLGVAMVT